MLDCIAGGTKKRADVIWYCNLSLLGLGLTLVVVSCWPSAFQSLLV